MYSCRVFSFDPFEEAKFFTDIRLANNRLANSVEISVNEKWKFYRLGISHRNSQLDFTRLKTGDILNLTMILRLTGMEHREIDVLKMDIDGAEKDIINKFDINYLCKYVKQLMMETHGNFRFSDLVMLERCFLMFRRDTRFFEHKDITPTLGLLTEFQLPDGFNLNLKPFRNENFLAEYMFTNGELYFINKNFLS